MIRLIQRFRPRTRAGYSLMEVLIAVAIIAVLATLVGPRLFGLLEGSKVTTARAQIRMIETSLDTLRLDIDRYPTEEEGLALLVTPNEAVSGMWTGPYLEDGLLPDDPWGRPYQYRVGSGADRGQVFSYGADGQEGGSGNNADIGL